MNIKYSIVVPCFNSESYLRDAVNSIALQQAENSYEIICINDGSRDSTLSLLKELSRNNSNIKIINNRSNKGVSHSRNLGIKAAKGDYVLFLDSDDIYTAGLFDKLDKIIKNSHPSIVSFGYERVGGLNKKNRVYSKPELAGQLKANVFLDLFLTRKIFQSICTVAIKRDLLINNSIFFNESISLGEDIAFQIKAMSVSEDIYYISEVFFSYKYNPGSVSNSNYSVKHLSCTENYSDVSSFVFSNSCFELIGSLNFYYQYIFFYELRGFLSVKDEAVLQDYLSSSVILEEKIDFNVGLDFYKLLLLKLTYKYFPSVLFLLLR